MKVLSLDIANKTGWKTSTDSGVFDFSPKRGESSGMSTVRFKARIIELITAEDIELVSVELPAGRNSSALISMGKKHGVLEEYCTRNNIEIAVYSASQIKKFATGKGNCGKPEMIEACKNKYNHTPIDDNEADAIHLYYLTLHDLGIRQPRRRRRGITNKK